MENKNSLRQGKKATFSAILVSFIKIIERLQIPQLAQKNLKKINEPLTRVCVTVVGNGQTCTNKRHDSFAKV